MDWFGQPLSLGLLLVAPIAAALYLLAKRRRTAAAAAFGNRSLIVTSLNSRRRALKAALVVTGLVFLALAAARPRFGFEQRLLTQEGVDVIIALDTSLSMAAEDVAPHRLGRAKVAIATLLDNLRGNRVGLILFAGSSALRFPLTTDLASAKSLLDFPSAPVALEAGTAISEAVAASLKAFEPGERKHRALVLLSDGEDHSGSLQEASLVAAGEGIIIYALGVGTPDGGPIPVARDADRGTTWKRDADGQVVVTALNEPLLQELAESTGGKYYRLEGGGEALLVARDIARLEKKELLRQVRQEPREGFQLFALVGLLALGAEALISERKTVPRRPR